MAASGEGGESVGGASDGGAPVQGGGAGSAGTGGGLGGGGRGGAGGTGGSAGGPGVTCGNDTVDPGEGCDDGNVLDLDGCSSSCKSKCETCVDFFYGDDPDYQWLVDKYLNQTDVATDGPAINTPRSKLAQGLLKCIVTSECILKDSVPMSGCYCGGISNTECEAGKAMGPCVKEIGNATEGKDYGIVADRISNITLASGVAIELAKLQGGQGFCVGACREDRDVTPCELCLAGSKRGMTIPIEGCTACLTDGNCFDSLIACAEEKCADGNMEPCLGAQPGVPDDIAKAGPCKEVAIAAGAKFALSADFLRCEARQCKSECLAP